MIALRFVYILNVYFLRFTIMSPEQVHLFVEGIPERSHPLREAAL